MLNLIYNFYINNWFLLIATSLAYYLVFLFLLRKRIVGIYDPLHTALILLSIYFSFNLLIFYQPKAITIAIFLNTFVVIVGYALRNDIRDWDNKKNIEKEGLKEKYAFKIFTYLVFLILITDMIVNKLYVLVSFGNSFAIHERYVFMENSKALYRLASPLYGFLIFFVYMYRRKPEGYFALFLWMPFHYFSYITGGKSAALVPVFDILMFIYMNKIDSPNKIVNKNLSIFVIALASVGFVGLMSRLKENFITVMSVLYMRSFMGFDQLIYLTFSDLKLEAQGLSMVKFYFGPLFKAINLYNEKYNGVNHYIANVVLGYKIDEKAMYPNTL